VNEVLSTAMMVVMSSLHPNQLAMAPWSFWRVWGRLFSPSSTSRCSMERSFVSGGSFCVSYWTGRGWLATVRRWSIGNAM
jgi:hypothetical protein